MTVFLGLQIFDDFEFKYLPLPKRCDTNFNVPLSIDDLYLKNSLGTAVFMLRMPLENCT